MSTGAAPQVDRWILPGELARAADPAPPVRPRRTARDWAVDLGVFAVAVGWGATEFATSVLANPYGLPGWLRVLDPVLGALLCLSLWWRRRFPLALGIAAAVTAAASNTATGAVLVLLFSLALHRGWRWALAVTLLGFPLGIPYVVAYFPNVGDDPLTSVLVLCLLVALVGTAGLAVRARRQLVVVLRLRADEARREHARELESSRREERARIAREMHDTLAHRISLLSVHAGALEYRIERAADGGAPLTPEEVRGAVGVMRNNAHAALEELREVLDVLRRPGDGPDGAPQPDHQQPDHPQPDHPQPTAARLPELVADARAGGQDVTTTFDGDLGALRAPLQRTVYRTVQEGLTNARKHAPGAPVTVLVRAAEDGEVLVEVDNAVADGGPAIPGSGSGLAGLAERVAVHGGTLTGSADGGAFRLRARIPAAGR